MLLRLRWLSAVVATLSPVQRLPTLHVRGTSSHVFELLQSLEALSHTPIDAIWYTDISHIDIIKHFLRLVQNFEA